jgi:hypothetical protein
MDNYQRLKDIVDRQLAIIDRAEEQGRDELTDDEAQRWDALESEYL